MHRQPLLKLLSEYTQHAPQMADTIERYTQFVNDHADCFERSLQVGHVTGSAWLLNNARTHVLLTHHKKLNRWLQLGGHADGDTDVLNVAFREATEESGLTQIQAIQLGIFDLDIHEIPARGSTPAHDHLDARFAFVTTSNENFIVSDESHDLAWVKLDELHTKTDEPSMLRMAAATASLPPVSHPLPLTLND